MSGRYNPNFRLTCPSPYVLDQTLGTCVEPTPTGFVYQNGRFIRQCLPGMVLNEFGKCIRPVMTRKSFVNETSIEKTIIALGANEPGGSHGVILGTYDTSARDMEFTTQIATTGSISQLKLVDGSQSLFLAATDNRGSPNGSGLTQSNSSGSVFIGAETVSVSNASGSYSSASNVTYSNATTDTGIEPDDAVFKLEYANIAPGGKMFMLGQPRNKIYVADFSASLYDTNTSGVGLTFNFDEPAFSVQGDTEPYYVGSSHESSSPFTVTSDGSIVTTSSGIIQSSFDSARQTSATPFFQGTSVPVPSAATAASKLYGNMPNLNQGGPPGPTGPSAPGHQNVPYNPLEPVNPWPQVLKSVSDVSSRGFTNRTDSKGYVFAGINRIPLNSDVGLGTSVRYLLNDPGPLTLPPFGPYLPATMAHTDINLQLGPNSGEIRVARFDVASTDTNETDTIYVFATDDTNASTQTGPLLSFISENHVYGETSDSTVPIVLVVGPPSAPTKVLVIHLPYNTINFTLILESLVSAISQQLNVTNLTVNLAMSYDRTQIFQLDILCNAPIDFSFGCPTTGSDGIIRLGPLTSTQYPTFTDMALSSGFFGFEPGVLYRAQIQNSTQDAVSPMPNSPSPQTLNTIALYNGLSWDDPYVPQTSLSPVAPTRPIANAMPIKFQGSGAQGISAWSYNPLSQGFAFATGTSAAPPNGLGAFSRSEPIFFKEGLTQWRVPSNCIDIKVHMWGAGGSSDPNSTGTGGAGAYIQGHLQKWSPGDSLSILVGSGGSGNTFGSGGIGSRSGMGRGGGRSAIILKGYDLATVGGGGGSVGRGFGGSASGTTAPAMPGSSADGSANGGLGAHGSQPGRGGKIFGDPQFKYAPDGLRYAGANSTSTLTHKASGGGGGGSGYSGGGSGGFLGYTGDLYDVATGGGGGSSFSDNLLEFFGTSSTSYEAPFTTSPYYMDNVAKGGSPGNSQGGPGLIVIVVTTSLNPTLLGSPAAATSASTLWASKPNAFTSMTGNQWGSVTSDAATAADWTTKFVQLVIPPNIPGSCDSTGSTHIDAIYYGNNGLIVAVVHSDNGSVYMPETTTQSAYSFVWWTYINANSLSSVTMTNAGTTAAFGPLLYNNGSSTQQPMSNVTTIRSIDSNELVFVGQGVRIASAPANLSGSWNSSKLIVDESGVPLDESYVIVDSQMNENLNSLELVGRPSTLNVSSVVKSPWAPQFASFYESTDVPEEIISYIAWSAPAPASAPPIGIASPRTDGIIGSGPLIAFNDIRPNTIFLINFGLQDLPMIGWHTLNIYDTKYVTDSQSTTSLSNLRAALQQAVQQFVNYICSLSIYSALALNGVLPAVSVDIGPDNVLAISITGLGGPVRPIFTFAFSTSAALLSPSVSGWSALFASSVTQDINNALQDCAHLLGFDPTLETSTTESTGIQEWVASWLAPRSVGLTSVPGGPANAILTPLSVPLDINSAFSGSIYHTYSPVVKMAIGDSIAVYYEADAAVYQPVIVSIGGPFCSAVETIATSGTSSLDQPISSLGANYYLDFVNTTDTTSPTGQSWRWAIMSSSNQIIQPDDPTSLEPIRSPANILVSVDNGSSYSFTESFLADYLLAKGTKPHTMNATTALDCFHTRIINNSTTGIGPAKLRDLVLNASGSSGLLNAMVSQFNDVKYYSVPSANSSGPQGFFLAVGQFLWETNSVLADPQYITWPTNFQQLTGVVWASLDGHLWTTVPMRLQSSALSTATENELFWMVYKTDLVDPINSIATLLTDLGMYIFNVVTFMDTLVKIFTLDGPVTNFTATGSVFFGLTPVGRTGPFAAVCTSRDSTGTCIKCTNGAQPVSIAQIVGASGSIQPNFDTCMLRPLGPQDDPKAAYSSIEALVDADAIASYAGYDLVGTGTKPSSYVKTLRQSFYSEGSSGQNSLIVCPKFTNVNSTPATAIGSESYVADQMQCALDPALADPNSTLINVSGGAVVRRPVKSLQTLEPDYTYDGSAYQANYALQYRNVTFVAYDTYSNVIPDVCPSTLGIGGSTNVGPTLTQIDAYGPIGKNIQITNQNYQETISGPLEENQSLGPQGANWNPSTDKNRAVLANENDTLDKFGYASLNDIVYNPSNQGPVNGKPFQSTNPFLYRLASFQFPYDGQSTSKPDDGTAGSTYITIGRDPQVYEPGFGPLKYYAEIGVGFAASRYNTPAAPWPANPLPQEGLGYWHIRPNNNTSGSNAVGILETGLGYGTILLQPTVVPYGQGPTATGLPLFMYDTSGLGPTSTSDAFAAAATKYLNQNWTSYVPYSPSSNLQTTAAAAGRSAGSIASLQNMLALRLKNSPTGILATPKENWKYLVCLNFFRPRNWAFLGLNLDANGIVETTFNAFGVPQQVLCSDQPNHEGLYEFLVPDPFFALQPMGPDILGYRGNVFNSDGSHGTDYDRLTTIIGGLKGSLSKSLSIFECPPLVMSNIIQKHLAFHYWTYSANNQSAILDLFVNVGTMNVDIDWSKLTMPDSLFDLSLLPSILEQIASGSTGQNAVAAAINAAIMAYALNPLKAFVWTDSTTQTTRSLMSMLQQGLQISPQNVGLSNGCELVYCLGLSASGFAKKIAGQQPKSPQDYDGSSSASFVHHRYKIVLPVNAQGQAAVGSMFLNNTNALALFGYDSSFSTTTGFAPISDPRGFAPNANFKSPSQLINVDKSDYDVETNNAPFFTTGNGPRLIQDLLAQNGTGSGTSIYGDMAYGFGLRIDSDAVIGKPRTKSLGAPDVPCDHGYVSMVRTIVDGQKRFTQPVTVDQFPHVTRLTYVTKYVPSSLKAYGAIVPFAPMRYLGSAGGSGGSSAVGPIGTIAANATVQNILNPFRPSKVFFAENVLLVTWSRTNAWASAGANWYAFSANNLDLEAPGFWGRQPLVLQNGVANDFFTWTTDSVPVPVPTAKVFAQDNTMAVAGYDGFLNGLAFGQGSTLNSVINTRAITIDPNNLTSYSAYLQNAPANKAIAGQMLVNVSDLLDPSLANEVVRLEITLVNNTTYNSEEFVPQPYIGRFQLTLTQFMTTYMNSACTTFGLPVPTVNDPVLCTHSEITQIVSTAIQNWIRSQTLIWNSAGSFIFSGVYDRVTDRPSFTFTAPGYGINIFRLVLPSPLSNWLGLRPVAPPMYDITDSLNSTSIYNIYNVDNFGNSGYGTALYSSLLPLLQLSPPQDSSGKYIGPSFVSLSEFMSAFVMGVADQYAAPSFTQFMVAVGYFSLGSSVAYIFTSRDTLAPACNIDTGLQGTIDNWTRIQAAGATRVHLHYDAGSAQPYWTDKSLNAVNNLVIGTNQAYVCQQTPFTGTSWANSQYWTSSGWTSRTSTPLYNLYYESSSRPYDANFQPPHETNAYIPPQKMINTITFNGRSGFDDSGLKMTEDFTMCDITNVSWTTRLASTPAKPYYWGLVGPRGLTMTQINTYHAAAELSSYAVPTSAVPVPLQVQSQPTSPLFMQYSSTGSTTSVLATASALSNCNFLEFAGLAALEVPCGYGSQTRPVNYKYVNQTIASIATSADADPTSNNCAFSTRQTYNSLQIQTSGSNGSATSPFVLKSMQYSALVPGVLKNSWLPYAAPQAPLASIGLSDGFTTDANGTTVFLVNQECYFNVGSLSRSTRPNTTGYSVYAFNWSELFDTTAVQPFSSIQTGAVDLSKYQHTYLRAVPLYMDEAYDDPNAAPFSRLGRSLLINSSTLSSSYGPNSAAGQPLSFDQPVVLLVCPSAADTGPFGYSGSVTQTFSNALVYSYTEPYSQPQNYAYAFTSIADGPVWTFYGLDNATDVTISGSSSAAPVLRPSDVQRKVYRDFSGHDVSQILGLDVRQVYQTKSACITQEFKVQWPPKGSLSVPKNLQTIFKFQVASYEQPDWTKSTTVQCPFLPLAGTWPDDDDASTEESGIQAVANYEGLSLAAIWGPNPVGPPATPDAFGSTVFNEYVMGMPKYTQWAVDRNAAGPKVPTNTYDNPFLLGVYDLYRPSTVFVMICDIWRNSLRSPMQVPPNNSTGTNPVSAINTTLTDSSMLISFVDCMGPEDYDSQNVNRKAYFGMCSDPTRTDQEKLMQPQTSVATWNSSPWVTTVGGTGSTTMIWSPFTGGSFWNTFESGNTSSTPQKNEVQFSPSLWWPTYRWSIGTTDPNNVWPTSVATNDSLLLANQIMLTCTDGTIRKMVLRPASSTQNLAYPIVDSTGTESFYNSGINGAGADGQSVYSFTWPGRLYNLTWWANHWWCTADNSSVWTTAPLNDENQTLINDPIVEQQFICSIIKFRPLAISEGSPWSSTTWPTNEPHKYNVMKVLQYEQQSCLFVGSVDGDFIVITQTGSRYQSVLPQNAPVPWPFLPSAGGSSGSIVYVTDILTDGQSILVGSSPLALDPNAVDVVPWYNSVTKTPIPLPLLSLAYTLPSLASINDLINSNHNIWPSALVDANVVSVKTALNYAENALTVGSAPIDSILAAFSAQISSTTIGTTGQFAQITFGTNGSITVSPSIQSSGLSRLLGQSASAEATMSIWQNEFVYKNPDPTRTELNISLESIGINYGLQNNTLGSQPVGYSALAFQTNPVLITDPSFQSKVTSRSVQVPTFYMGGLDMDALTKAFFVIDSSKKQKLGVQTLVVPQDLTEYPQNNIVPNWVSALVAGADQSIPMWLNSVGLRAKLVSSDGSTLDSSVVRPINGPITHIKDTLLPSDYNDLNMYLSSLITRSSPLVANDVIADMAYGPEAAAMAWTSYSPYGSNAVSMASVNVQLTVLPTEANSAQNYASVQPQFTGPSIIAWSPYEMKYYVAGPATHVPDWTSSPETQSLIRPAGISEAKWASAQFVTSNNQPLISDNSSTNRLVLASSDLSQGLSYVSSDNVTYAMPFTQVYQVAPNTSSTANPVKVSLVAKNFTTIDCFGFSSTATAVGGSFQDGTLNAQGIANSSAIVMWRTNTVAAGDDLKANWSLLDLGTSGTVTAMKYVGYAWYIATWDPYARFDVVAQQYTGQSTMFFASINFNAASVLDAWNANSNALSRITSIDAVVPSAAVCTSGYEPDPNNPTMCVKVCPVGFKPFGSLCVQACQSPYTETGIANECVPDSLPARMIAATASGKATITPVLQEGPQNATIQDRGVSTANIITVIACSFLVLLFVGGMIKVFSEYKKKK